MSKSGKMTVQGFKQFKNSLKSKNTPNKSQIRTDLSQADKSPFKAFVKNAESSSCNQSNTISKEPPVKKRINFIALNKERVRSKSNSKTNLLNAKLSTSMATLLKKNCPQEITNNCFSQSTV